MLVFLLCLLSVSVVGVVSPFNTQIVTSNDWIVGDIVTVEVSPGLPVTGDLSVSVLDVNGNSFSFDTLVSRGGGVWIYSVRVPPVETGNYKIKVVFSSGGKFYSFFHEVFVGYSVWDSFLNFFSRFRDFFRL